MKRNRIFDDKYEFFQKVCQRDSVNYDVLTHRDDYYEVSFQPEITNSRFKELLEDIECEVQRSNYKFDRPVFSARTLCMPEKFSRLIRNETNLKGRPQRTFSILEGDERRIAFYPEIEL